jgi:predicted glutamine amidotransferase
MCRLFAFRSTLPLCEPARLYGSGNSLASQSCRDARGECHVDGWGMASFDGDGHPHVTKSLQSAFSDPRFGELARSVTSTTLVAHVRQASVGGAALVNTHPFVHGRWVFAHNGTLEDFAARKGPLVEAIDDDLRQMIRGDTDSEHAFFFWLSQLRAATGGLDTSPSVELLITTLQRTIKLLDGWFPAHNGEESKFTFVVTNGRLLAATRWGRSLSCLEHRDGNARRAVYFASEPTDGDSWREVPDRSLVVVDERLDMHAGSLT